MAHCKDRTTTHTLDLDEHKERDRKNARRILAKGFVSMTTDMYENTENIESTFSKHMV